MSWDDRLPHNEVILGVRVGADSRAYPLDELVAVGGVVNEMVGEEPITVFVDSASSLSAAFSREVGGRVLDFRNVGEERLEIVDRQTGSTWTSEGRAVSGPLQGESLTFVTSFISEWYGWSAYHPGTSIYRAEEGPLDGSANRIPSSVDTGGGGEGATRAYCTSFERLGGGCDEEQDRLK